MKITSVLSIMSTLEGNLGAMRRKLQSQAEFSGRLRGEWVGDIHKRIKEGMSVMDTCSKGQTQITTRTTTREHSGGCCTGSTRCRVETVMQNSAAVEGALKQNLDSMADIERDIVEYLCRIDDTLRDFSDMIECQENALGHFGQFVRGLERDQRYMVEEIEWLRDENDNLTRNINIMGNENETIKITTRQDVCKLIGENDELSRDRRRLEMEVDDLRRENDKIIRDIGKIERERNELDGLHRQDTARLRDLESEVKRVEGELRAAEECALNFKREQEKVGKELGELKERSLKEKYEDSVKSATRNESNKAEVQTLRGQIKDRDQNLQRAESEIHKLRSEQARTEASQREILEQTELCLREVTDTARGLKERVMLLESINLELQNRNHLLLQEIEELKDLVAATKIRCKKFENKRNINTMLKEVGERVMD